MKHAARFLSFACALGLAACNHARVQTTESYLGPMMPRPDHIYVAYFSITPEQVRLDQGIGARITRAADDQPLEAQELQAAQAAQAALAEQLVDRLRKYGLPAEIAPTEPMGGNDLLVQGQIVGIDQGNRTRRILIGLGAGKSTVSADAQVYRLTAMAPPRFVSAFEGKADSGHMPGAAETMGAGAAAQRIGTSAALTGAAHAGMETRRTSDTAEAGGIADEIALRVGQLAVAQQWIPPSALQ
ncbi:DUF4410 domain-containing protein [Acidisphaera sp. S103]|uniref:DUF4410 domain-containing protein n=1 Tax=Acidisphaera sp. S103 TaxID=1747223 RepID=UPI00131B6EA9|nr:DUF4410 domain-containing protein [Acidisphaera sp. S103]